MLVVTGIAIFAALWAWSGWGLADRGARAACRAVALVVEAREQPAWMRHRAIEDAQEACSP
jgi:hypothetical protein